MGDRTGEVEGMGLRIYLTGATGAVGIGVVEECIRRGFQVTALVRPGSARARHLPVSDLVEVRECALADMKKVEDVSSLPLIQGKIPGKVQGSASQAAFIHLGWEGTIGGGREDEDLQQRNVEYTLDAVRLAARLGCKAFVGAGSQAEYGRPGDTPLRPETPCHPENAYGRAKLEAGRKSADLCAQLGLTQVWPRILSVYGPGDGDRTLISTVIRALLAGEKPALTAGEQMWDYLYSTDAGRALVLLAERACADHALHGRIYPLGSGQVRPLREYVEELREVGFPGAELGFGEIPYGEKQVMYLQADISALRQDVGFTPEVDFSEGIARTIAWRKEHR